MQDDRMPMIVGLGLGNGSGSGSGRVAMDWALVVGGWLSVEVLTSYILRRTRDDVSTTSTGDGWIDGSMDRWIDGSTDGSMNDQWLGGQVQVQVQRCQAGTRYLRARQVLDT